MRKLVIFGILFMILLTAFVSSARLPTVGGDDDAWGTVINEYLTKLSGENATQLNETKVNASNIYPLAINTTHIKDGTITDADISDTTNLTLGQKITFALGEIIDNIVDDWLRITGSLNVTGNLIAGNLNSINCDVKSTTNGTLYCGTDATGVGSSPQWQSSGNDIYNSTLGVRVGINTSTPQNTLNVIGDVNITGDLTLGGSVTGQNTTRIKVTKNNAQIFTNGVVQKIQYDDEEFDNLGEYDNATNYRFTATQAGYYLVVASILTESNDWTINDLVTLDLRKNGTKHATFERVVVQATVADYILAKGSSIVYLAEGDYLEMWLSIARGADTGIYVEATDSPNYNYFEVTRIHSPFTLGSTAGVPEGAMIAFTGDCPVGWTFNHTSNGTGGIIESGSNSNGYWIKFSDGTMMAWHKASFTPSSMTLYGSIYYSNAYTWTYPVAFASAPKVEFTLGSTTGIFWPLSPSGDPSATTATTRVGSGANALVSVNVMGFATGNWTNTPQPTLNYCVKTGEDSSISNTIWATSGNDIILNNANKNLRINSSAFFVNASSGNVGIGTTSPSVKLEVNSSTNNYGLLVGDGTHKGGFYLDTSANRFAIGTQSNHNLSFFTNNGAYQITLLTNGNVGIGNSTPSEKLEVTGNIKGDRINTLNFLTGAIANNGFYTVLAHDDIPTGAMYMIYVTSTVSGTESSVALMWKRTATTYGGVYAVDTADYGISGDSTNGIRVQNIAGADRTLRIAVHRVY